MKKTDNIVENHVIDLYNNGNSCRKIGIQLSLNSTTIFNILKRNKVKTRTNGGIDILPINDIIDDYKNGLRVVDISKKYGVCERTIYNYLDSANINRDHIYYNESLNRDYFEWIDSYDKAYFLGLLISDGYISNNTNEISITLRNEDSYILEIFSQKIKNQNPLYKNPYRNESTIHFKSKRLKDQLSYFGVVNCKSLITYLPILIPESNMNHLLRGIFDGNGWISLNPHTIGFCAGNETIITQIRDYLINKLFVYPVKVIHSQPNVYQCSWSAKRDFLEICHFLYYNKQDCFLYRKYNKFMEISS